MKANVELWGIVMDPAARILIVDDNPSNIEICREILDREFGIITATNGLEAIRSAQQESPQVVLLDVMMPGIDGYETCRRLRRLHGMETALIIMLSAKAMPDERAQGLAAGADAYITKPFSAAELLSIAK